MGWRYLDFFRTSTAASMRHLNSTSASAQQPPALPTTKSKDVYANRRCRSLRSVSWAPDYLYKKLFLSNNICNSHTVRYVCAASASVAIWEDRLRAGLITSAGTRRTTSPLSCWKAVATGIIMPERG